MNRWTGCFGFLLGIAFSHLQLNAGLCQDFNPTISLESLAGISYYDDDLSFDASPSFGLGAGIDITHMLQLNLSLSINPTQQRIAQAASTAEARFSVYQYALSLKTVFPVLTGFLRPYVGFSGGGMIINPHPVILELGPGQQIISEPPGEHLWTFGFIGGAVVPLGQRFGLRMEARHLLHHLNRAAAHDKWLHSNGLQLGLIIDF